MSYSITINGHVGTKEAEREVIRAVKKALNDLMRDGVSGVSYARMVSSHHGNFDMLTMKQDDEGIVDVEEDENLEVTTKEKTEFDSDKKETAKKTVPSLKDAQGKK
jgi:hypothetical protein